MSEEVYVKRLSFRCIDPENHPSILFVLQGKISLETMGQSRSLVHLQPVNNNVAVFKAADHDLTVTQVPCRVLRVCLPVGAAINGNSDQLMQQIMVLHADLGLLATMLLLIEQSIARSTPESISQELVNTLFAYLWDRLEVAGASVVLTSADPGSMGDPLQQLEAWLPAHLGEPLVLSDLASAVNLSARRLQELCRHHYGYSPMDRLRRLRLAVLASQLSDASFDHLTIASLMRGLQLSDTHVTRHSFQRLYGKRPSEYRLNRKHKLSSFSAELSSD